MMEFVLFVFSTAAGLLLFAGVVRGFNWLIRVLGLDDDSWPLGPR